MLLKKCNYGVKYILKLIEAERIGFQFVTDTKS